MYLFFVYFLVPDSVFLDRSYSNLTVVNGDLIILTCALFGATPVSLVWRKDGRDMDEYESTAHQTNGSLLIQIRGREDSGRYECVALHQGRHEVRVVDVEVYGKQSIISAWLTQSVEPYYDAIRFICQRESSACSVV